MGVVDVLKGLDVEEALLELGAGLRPLALARRVPRDLHRAPTAGDRPGRALAGGGRRRRHGADTLAAFKLRGDLDRRWSPDGDALAGYRVQGGALLLAGDPVGTDAAKAALLRDTIAHARRHGLALGVVAASPAFADIARECGLYRLYMGDEALVPTGPMDLSLAGEQDAAQGRPACRAPWVPRPSSVRPQSWTRRRSGGSRRSAKGWRAGEAGARLLDGARPAR